MAEIRPLIRDSVTGRVSEFPNNGDTLPASILPPTAAGIPELSSDPVVPAVNSAWVLKTEFLGGSPIGLLLALTKAALPTTYQLSYKTIAGPVVRVALS